MGQIALHIKDAIAHATNTSGNEPPKLSDFEYFHIARYLDNLGLFNTKNEVACAILLNAIDSALDLRDEGGSTLRDYRFDNEGFVSTLQQTLLRGLCIAKKVTNDNQP